MRLEASPTEGRYRGQPAAREVTARVWMGRPVTRVEVGRGAGPGARAAEPEVALRVADAAAAGAAAASAWWAEGPLVWVRVPQVGAAEALSVVIR